MGGTRSGSRRTFCGEKRPVSNAVTSRSVTVVNQLGMHARAAAKFVHLAARFESRIRVGRDGREMDGKSIMGILLLAAAAARRSPSAQTVATKQDAVAALVDTGRVAVSMRTLCSA